MHAIAPRLQMRFGRLVSRLSGIAALFGGVVLVAMATVTTLSVIGRALPGSGLSAVRGDFELVEIGCAVAVFAFLPWCQVNRGHVRVDLVTERLPARGHAAFGLLGDAALTACSGVILWRLWLGFVEKFPHGSDAVRALLGMGPKPFFPETTYELQMPVWIPFGLALIGAALFVLACVASLWRSLNWTLTGAEPDS